MKTNTFNPNIFESENAIGFIHDWYSLAVMLGVYPNALSYVGSRSVDSFSERIVLKKKRVVYRSKPVLKNIQTRIGVMISNQFNLLPEDDRKDILAYVKNVKAAEQLGETIVEVTNTGKSLTAKMAFDIRKFFDNITKDHVVYALQQIGMCSAGAKLVARYCMRSGGLQQGSVCSPVISNIVGWVYFDKPIKEFLRSKEGITWRYKRYCDNLVLLVFDEYPQEFYAEYKAKCTEILERANFRGHKWSKITHNNPRVNMRWLGTLLGTTGVKIERSSYDILRGELFRLATANNCVGSLESMALANGLRATGVIGDVSLYANMLLVLRGRTAYVTSINKKQGLRLSKLLKVIALRVQLSVSQNTSDYLTNFRAQNINPEMLQAIKAYKSDAENITTYTSRISALAGNL